MNYTMMHGLTNLKIHIDTL